VWGSGGEKGALEARVARVGLVWFDSERGGIFGSYVAGGLRS